MTISANYTFNPHVDDIVKMGAQLAGVVPLGRTLAAEQMPDARMHLQTLLKDMQAEGVGMSQWENTTLALVAGTASYVLPADTVGVDFPMMTQKTGETSQIPVFRFVWEQYQTTINKTTQGRPTACYEEATHSVTLKFWPVPDVAYTLAYRRERLIRDADSGTTVDLRPRWQGALVAAMAHKLALANSLGVERVKTLKDEADEKIAKAKGREHEGGSTQFVADVADYFS